MDTQKNNENIVLKLKRHLGKMMVQVDFLYRNGRPLEQFDYDILMERTREFYELLIDSQEFDTNQNPDPNFDEEENQNNEALNNDVEFEIEMPGETKKEEEDDIDEEDWEDEEDVTFHVERKEEREERLEIRDERLERKEEREDKVTIENGKTIHAIFVDESDEEEMRDERLEIREERLERKEERLESKEERMEKNLVNLVNPVEKNINPVEKNTNPVYDSLAARLQRRPISDIKSAMSLNDRIMMINDLFKGSSERYNKTINVLNEFPTLGGAIVYLSELRVELQWDVESEAYMKLQELVQRRFL